MISRFHCRWLLAEGLAFQTVELCRRNDVADLAPSGYAPRWNPTSQLMTSEASSRRCGAASLRFQRSGEACSRMAGTWPAKILALPCFVRDRETASLTTIILGESSAETVDGVGGPNLGFNATYGPGGFQMQFNGPPGVEFVIYSSTDLRLWTPVHTNTGLFPFVIGASPAKHIKFFKATVR